MCALGFFRIFLEKGLLVDKILGFTFFQARKDGIFPSTVVEFCGRWIVYNSPSFAQKKPFRELSVSQQEKFGPKTKCIYEKQI